MSEIIMDTNILFSGLYSASGASFKILEHLAAGRIRLALSTPLLFEYEDVLKRNQTKLNLLDEDIDVVLDNLCAFSRFQKVYFLWRPYLPDAKGDLVLELAVAAKVKTIVTHNLKDFVGIDKFGVEAIVPKTLLERL
ncbi:putative toxin-antitoxin system toxin component, PIN family [Methylobacter sp.]|uniref:putative toxin-antitoxin system toxin component, PIN family n=1 Tax=Methylobacter sp. TaxID=2051955 RepID=UPI002489A41F|nr:putative toxin-antitoxin system toxin component, PIN family [Methylobacter sp.]MDI1277853.1 putative toxin-antitoxin system toxin component, PIN family [Methylobacter sp.]MDI1358622.1 putative toxin-antitoxin system toxin component, PIN family [Methylobacter sp.]